MTPAASSAQVVGAQSIRESTVPPAGPRVLHLVYREGLSSIFESRVAMPAGQLARLGYPIDLLVFTPVGEFLRPAARRQWSRKLHRVRELFPGPVVRFPSPPARFRSAWDDAALLDRWIRRHCAAAERLIIHCRGASAVDLALRATRRREGTKVIFDMRGVPHLEHLQQQRYARLDDAPESVRAESIRRQEAERLAFGRADQVLCLSHRMAEYAESVQPALRGRIEVHPCFVDTERFVYRPEVAERIRAELGLAGKFVVVYSGSLKSWHVPEAGIEVFRSIKRMAPSAHYLVVTTDPQKMRALAAEAGLAAADFTALSVPHLQVPDYLCAGDLGIETRGLFQPPNLIDRVSSPTKIGEYLACGLPVIMSADVGDYPQLLAEHDLGVTAPFGADPAQVERDLQTFLARYRASPEETRERCRRAAESLVSARLHVTAIARLYQRLSPELPQGRSGRDANTSSLSS